MLIMSINEFLLSKEFRNINLLYHSTTFSNLLQILEDNVLYGSDSYDYGIATSRNKDYLFYISDEGDIERGQGECQLILDRNKINNNYKIKAFDWEEFKLKDDDNYHQSEDKILTDKITNIKKYIIGIQLNKNIQDNLMKLLNKENLFIKKNNIKIFGKNWEILSKQF